MCKFYPLRLLFVWVRPSVAALAAVLVGTSGCDDAPTETISRCFPDEAACAPLAAGATALAPDLVLGKDTYAKRCVSCHGQTGTGTATTVGIDLTSSAIQSKWSDADLAALIVAGRGTKMPGQRLPPKELSSVVAHVRTLARPDDKPATTAPYAPR